jgi:hypothetical protein
MVAKSVRRQSRFAGLSIVPIYQKVGPVLCPALRLARSYAQRTQQAVRRVPEQATSKRRKRRCAIGAVVSTAMLKDD